VNENSYFQHCFPKFSHTAELQISCYQDGQTVSDSREILQEQWHIKIYYKLMRKIL